MAASRAGHPLPLPAPPSPWPWVAAAALTGLVAGTLFQGYVRTGIGFFRMFATLGVVWIGYCATRALSAAQQAAGLAELAAALRALPPTWRVGGPLATRDGAGRADLVVVGARAAFLLALDRSSALPGAVRPRQRLAARLWAVRHELAAALPEPVALHLVLCPLQAPPARPAWVDGALVVAPAELAPHLQRLEDEADAAGVPPSPAGAEALRALLASPA